MRCAIIQVTLGYKILDVGHYAESTFCQPFEDNVRPVKLAANGAKAQDCAGVKKKLGVIEAIKEIMNAQNATPKCRDTGHTGTP